MRRGVVALVVLVLAAQMRADGGPPRVRGGYAVLALEDVILGRGVRVAGGDVGANLGTVRLAPRTRVAGTVAASAIRIAAGARAGRLFCILLEAPLRFACQPVTLPLVDTASLPLVQVLPGLAPITVPAGGRFAPLAAGSYGAVRVAARARLVLGGGSTALRSLALGRGARVECAGACEVAVEKPVRLAAGAQLGAGNAAALHLTVQGDGRPTAFSAGPHAQVTATVYAPGGAVRLGRGGRFAGSFVGRSVAVGAGARIAGAAS